MTRTWMWTVAGCLIVACSGCLHHKPSAKSEKPYGVAKPALKHTGHEIVVCGQMFDTGAPVVLWTDPGGYDMYGPRRSSSTGPASTRAATRASTQPRQMHLRTSPLTAVPEVCCPTC